MCYVHLRGLCNAVRSLPFEQVCAILPHLLFIIVYARNMYPIYVITTATAAA